MLDRATPHLGDELIHGYASLKVEGLLGDLVENH